MRERAGKMSHSPNAKERIEYAWNYFQLHAGQRMSLFNFFVVISALLTGGLATSIRNDNEFEHAIIRILLGVGLMITSFVFWKLDQRVRYLIKHAENALKKMEHCFLIENESQDNSSALFLAEEEQTVKFPRAQLWKFWEWHMYYSKCFGVVYITFAAIGFLGVVLAVCRLLCPCL
ncbi:MAG: hypothetical protein A2Z25_14320 [Planctomycetes bacterium RBG_16_55_9]|nr:MAG: hypothetical protein A2Z25_14320 [Planctomycetes bacterium RBG_16_55_9]